MRITAPQVSDADALTDLHLDVWEEAYAGLLLALYVRASAYGTGVGHALCEAALGPAPAYLWVLDGNERAIGFYERQGFGFDGTTKAEDVGLERRMVRR